MAEGLEVVAFGFARDALDKQDAVLTELRARTGTLLAASSIVASFLGATAIGRHGLTYWSVAALVGLAVSLVLCVGILLPRSDLSFSVDGPETYEELYEWRDEPLEVHRRLAYAPAKRREENQGEVDRLFGLFRCACLALGLELILWSLALAIA